MNSRDIPLDEDNMTDAECYVNVTNDGALTLVTCLEHEVIPLSKDRVVTLYKAMKRDIDEDRCPFCHNPLFNECIASYPPIYVKKCHHCGAQI